MLAFDPESILDTLQNINLQSVFTTFNIPTNILTIVIAVLIAVTNFIIKRAEARDSSALLKTSYVISIITSYLIISYGHSVRDMTWFCSPDSVGWIMTIINFVIFGYIAKLQFENFTTLFGQSVSFYDWYIPKACALLSWPAAIILMIVGALVFQDSATTISNIILGLFLIAQLGFIIITIYKAIKERQIWAGIFAVLFYWITTIATLLIILQFIGLFIIAMLILIGLSIFSKGSSSSRSSSSSSSYDSGRVKLPNGNDLYEIPGGGLGEQYYESGGDKYKSTDGGRSVTRID